MKSFDYESAWAELALPAYKKLTNQVLVLVEETGIVAAELRQDRDCNMVWPDDGGKLRAMFDAIDSEALAAAARTVYFYGHWRPGASIAGDAPHIAGGGNWKFANYADQVLRARFNVSGRDSKATVSFQIHEGTIRVCYSSPDCWTWHEVAPATDDGMKAAGGIADSLRRKISGSSRREDRDSAASIFFEQLKKVAAWPDFDTSGYMVEESVLELRRAARMPKPDKSKLIAKINADFQSKLASETVERDGMPRRASDDINRK
jgi:hypothetical protein